MITVKYNKLLDVGKYLEISYWCKENCHNPYSLHPSFNDFEPVDIHGPRIVFYGEEDALLFKLVWT